MSLLTPLYIAGLLAVSLPLVFHLIRRSPRGEFPFSSLMFLSPSPPRLTRRSRLDHLLLLLLRATALVLLAMAFARPFWRQAAQFGVDETGGRRVAILLDTSASMRRQGLWQQALAKAGQVLDDLGPGDDAALFAFGADVHTLVRFNDVVLADPRQHLTHLRNVLKDLTPAWTETNFAGALIAAADELHELGDAKNDAGDTTRQIVLISDLQRGGRLEELQSYEWPDDVQLDVQRIDPLQPGNAGLHLAGDLGGSTEKDKVPSVRVRITNDPDSDTEQFELHWAATDDATPGGDPISVYVPPGEGRVIRVPRPPGTLAASRLLLGGDDHPFDNTLYLVPLRQQEITLLYLGGDAADDPQGLRYYLERAFPETPRRKVLVLAQDVGQPLRAEDLLAAQLVVVGEAMPDESLAPLGEYMRGGGTVFCVLRKAADGTALARLMDRPDIRVEEGQVEGAALQDYAMLSEISFGHPLFATFANPRFNDFTKIHFWKHRRVNVRDEPSLKVLARFDDGAPALFEQTRGKGRLLVLTSGWHPDDSQLARSTKFVPLVSGMLERAGTVDAISPQYYIGDAVALPALATTSGKAIVGKPQGAEVRFGRDVRTFDETDQPGVYDVRLAEPGVSGAVQHFAVNVAAAESKTAPHDVDELSQRGVRLGTGLARAELAERLRQMRDVELEDKQKLWRWLLVAVLGVLVVETWLAGHLSQPAREPSR